MKDKISLFMSCFFIVFVPAIHAQEEKTTPGPVKVSLGIQGEYTDNRDSLEDADENFDIATKPRIDIGLTGERTSLDFYYSPSFRYRNNPSIIQNDTQWHHDVALNLSHKIVPRLKVKVSERFNYTDDPAVDIAGIAQIRDCSYMMNRAEASANFEFSRRSNIDINSRYMIKQYDETGRADESNEDSLSGDIIFWRQVSRTMGMFALANITEYGYAKPRNIDRGFTSMIGGLGLEKIFNPSLRASLRCGWEDANYQDEEISAQGSPYGILSIQASRTPSMRIMAAGSYKLRDSDIFPFASQSAMRLYTKCELDVKNFTFGISGTYELGDYNENTIPSSALPPDIYKATSGEENTVIAQAELSYKIRNINSSIKLMQSYENVDSDVGESFARNTTGLVLTKHF